MNEPDCDFILGLDLGQTSDPSALAILKRTALTGPDGKPLENHRGRTLHSYSVGHLERFPLGTPYPSIVKALGVILARPEIAREGHARPLLGIDATGVGRAVVDMFIDADLPAELVPVTITSGEAEARRDRWNHANEFPSGPWSFWISKLELAGAIQSALSGQRLKIVPSLPLADVLKAELMNFRAKYTASANVTLGAWRERDHDDLVLAMCIACWIGDCARLPAVSFLTETPPRCQIPPRVHPVLRAGFGAARTWDRQEEDRGGPQRRPRRNFYGR